MPKPSDAALRRQLNAMKREQFPWMLEITKNAPQIAIIHLGQAFKNFGYVQNVVGFSRFLAQIALFGKPAQDWKGRSRRP